MPRPAPRPNPRPAAKSAPPNPSTPVEVIDPRWILKALGLTVIGALVCGYLTLCLLFYQGQWQLVLHPQRSTQPLDRLGGLPTTPVRFDAAGTGLPRLSGALIPAAEPARPYTVLYLRPGEASLAQSPADAATLNLLHGLGLAVFAFDYRGFGASDPAHPTLQRMTEDTDAALRYLLSRGIPENRILLYGTGTGASLATALAAAHPALPALILESPGEPSLAMVQADPRTRALLVRWLFHEDFSLAPLATLPTPKLLIAYTNPPTAFTTAATPKMILQLPPSAAPQRSPAIARFLDQYR